MNKYFIISGILLFSLFGCQRAPMFTVDGTISNAAGEMVYLEHTALRATVALDSCLLNAEGDFLLKAPAPTFPDFYRLRVGALALPLAVDSTETITVTTQRDSLPYTFSIEGSVNTLAIAQLRYVARTESLDELREKAKLVITANPRSLAAYYAVFLKKDGRYVWDIFDPSDRRMYQAVATSFQTWMPQYERTTALYGQVLDVLRAERSLQNQVAMQQFIQEADNAFLDITLPDEQGELQSLSDLRGDVIVLDFSHSMMNQYVEYNFELRELYNKYHKQGLAIYSVSLDNNQLAWEQATEHLPWVTVRADQNVSASVLMQYNVQGLPTLFLLDRKGNVQGRYIDFKQLEADIQKYL